MKDQLLIYRGFIGCKKRTLAYGISKVKTVCFTNLKIGSCIKNPAHAVQDYTCEDLGDLKKQNADSEVIGPFGVYEFARATITKYHGLRGLNNRLFSHNSGG